VGRQNSHDHKMKIKRLFKDIPGCQIFGSKECVISGISANSKAVAPGDLFIAKGGSTHHGALFFNEAMQAGAAAVLTDMADPSLKGVVQVVHPTVASIEALVASTFYHHPSKELLVAGITGTNGKTTTSFILKHLLDALVGSCGLIGTIEYIVGRQHYEASRTTPDVVTNQKFLREMCRTGSKAAVMEVTSHALIQGRVDEIDFDLAVYTHLSPDHLDYHGSMENYAVAKRKLFENLKRNAWGIINQDCSYGEYFKQGCAANCLTYAIDAPADLKAKIVQLKEEGSFICVSYEGSTELISLPLAGRFNVYNCLAAIGCLLTQGFALKEIARSIEELAPVRGRMQPVANPLGLQIFVDYAHTGDALANILKSLAEFCKKRLIVVFGCGGDRDKGRRPAMAEAAEKDADFVIVTTDNPRSEDPVQICREIAAGFKDAGLFIIELDRRLAIQKAIEMAEEGDTILIAGRGHEPYQILAHQTVEFDDAAVAYEICQKTPITF